MHVLVIAGNAQYYSLTDLRRDHPDTSFPAEITDELAKAFGVYPCEMREPPTVDDLVERVDQGPPANVDGTWYQTWVVSTRTKEEIEARRKAAVPAALTMRQARLALLGAGVLTKVDQAIALLPSPQREGGQIEWEYATEVRRDSLLVQQLGAALGLSEVQIDELFVAGSSL